MMECALLFDRYGVDVEGSFPIIGKGKGGKARINNSVPGLKHISTGKLPFPASKHFLQDVRNWKNIFSDPPF